MAITRSPRARRFLHANRPGMATMPPSGAVNFRFPRQNYTIDAHARPAVTADDVIRQQGGLSPSYGPSGLNDLYSRGPSAHQRLQDVYERAKKGDATGANEIEKAAQARGMGFPDAAQKLMNRVNQRDIFSKLGAPVIPPPTPPMPGVAPIGQGEAELADAQFPPSEGGGILPQQDAEEADALYPPTVGGEYNPFATGQVDPGFVPPSPIVPEEEQFAHGGMAQANNPILTGEAGPETKFDDDGGIEQINHPTIMQHPKPGVVVPNKRLQAFLHRFRRPPEDMAKMDEKSNGGIKPYASGGEVHASDDLVGDANALAGPPLGGSGMKITPAKVVPYASGGQVHSWEEPGYTAQDRLMAGRQAVANKQQEQADALTNASLVAAHGQIDPNPYGTGTADVGGPVEPQPSFDGVPGYEFFQNAANSPLSYGGPNKFAAPEPDSGFFGHQRDRARLVHGDRVAWSRANPRLAAAFRRWTNFAAQ